MWQWEFAYRDAGNDPGAVAPSLMFDATASVSVKSVLSADVLHFCKFCDGQCLYTVNQTTAIKSGAECTVTLEQNLGLNTLN